MLSAEIQAKILALHFGGKKSVRAIALELGVSRESVDRVIDRKSVVLGIERCARPSMLDIFRPKIEELLKNDPKIHANTILHRIRDEGYSGGYTILKELVSAKRVRISPKKQAFFKIDFPVGQTAQVDWGEFKNAFGDGLDVHCFVMVLCYSRLIYIEFTRSEKFEDFIRCHENAIRYFGDLLTEAYWYDNLPTAVSERMGPLTRFNARFFAYAGHHHFVPHACNVGKGNEKGRVEDGVKYIRSNFWEGRQFKNFEDLCRQASEWRDYTANLREHEATGKIPRLVFDAEERAKLRKCNPHPYDTDEVFSKELRPDYHIIYETNQYSAPWTLVGCVVTVRIDAEWIRIYYHDRFVTRHQRCYRKHQKPFTKPEHEAGLLEIKPQGKYAHLTWQIRTLESYGPPLKQYLECLRYSKRSLKQEISRLLALGTIYGEKTLAEAVESLLKRGSIGVDQLELALKHLDRSQNITTRPAPMSLQDEKLQRIPSRIDLRSYDGLILKSLERSGEPNPPEDNPTGAQKEKTNEHDRYQTKSADAGHQPVGDGDKNT
jgi:transposase